MQQESLALQRINYDNMKKNIERCTIGITKELLASLSHVSEQVTVKRFETKANWCWHCRCIDIEKGDRTLEKIQPLSEDANKFVIKSFFVLVSSNCQVLTVFLTEFARSSDIS